jgi:hypothetical protein
MTGCVQAGQGRDRAGAKDKLSGVSVHAGIAQSLERAAPVCCPEGYVLANHEGPLGPLGHAGVNLQTGRRRGEQRIVRGVRAKTDARPNSRTEGAGTMQRRSRTMTAPPLLLAQVARRISIMVAHLAKRQANEHAVMRGTQEMARPHEYPPSTPQANAAVRLPGHGGSLQLALVVAEGPG